MWEIVVRIFACVGTVGIVFGILKTFCFFRDRIRNKRTIFSTEVLFIEKRLTGLNISNSPFSFSISEGIVLRIRNKSDISQQITNIKFKSLSEYSMQTFAMFLSIKYVKNDCVGEIVFSGELVFPIKIEALSSMDIYVKSPESLYLLCCGNKIQIETGDGKNIITTPFDRVRHKIY